MVKHQQSTSSSGHCSKDGVIISLNIAQGNPLCLVYTFPLIVKAAAVSVTDVCS